MNFKYLQKYLNIFSYFLQSFLKFPLEDYAIWRKKKISFDRHNCKILKNVAYPGEIYDNISIVQNVDDYNARFWFARGIFVVLFMEEGGMYFFTSLKPNYFKKQHFSSSFLLTWSKYTGLKWQWSTRQANAMHWRHETSLLITPWPFWTCSFTSGM